MFARAARPAILAVLLACDPASPDARGTPGNALQVDLRFDEVNDGRPKQLQILGVGTDADVRTDLTVGDNQALVVVPSRGEPITYQGAPLRAEYHHVGRLLVVYQGTGDVLVVHNFVEPVRWYTVLRASL